MCALVLEKQILDVGVLALVLSLKAMLFNLLYNWMFDLFDVRAGRIPTQRNVLRRILHAVGFEIGLMITSLPIVVCWPGLSLLQALIMDLVVTSVLWCTPLCLPGVMTAYIPQRNADKFSQVFSRAR
jgi:uncharacterized membrane protein